jgi:hypothetical protein
MHELRVLDEHELDLVSGGAAGVNTSGTGDNPSSANSFGSGATCNYIMRAPGVSTGAPTITHEKM